MQSLSSIRDKNLKSRIPVPVTIQKPSCVTNREGRLLDKKPASRLQTSKVNKTASSGFLQEKQKTCGSLPDKSGKSNDRSVKGSKVKINTQPPLKTNIKNNGSKNEKQLLYKTNVNNANKRETQQSFKTNDNKKVTTHKANVNIPNKKTTQLPFKSNNKIVATQRTDANIADNKKETQQLFETNIKSEVKKENSPILKSDMKSEKFLTPKKHNISSDRHCFSAQKDIKFEVSEFNRNMILSGRELSPSMCKLMPGLRLSCVQAQRPSAYQKFEIPADPFKEALKAIENVSLSVKRPRKLSVKEVKTPLSPFKRGSFYTPCVDPKKEAMKSLDEFRLRQLQKNASKNAKKVTFNLNVQECTPQNDCDKLPKQFKDSECRLTQINEKSEENTPNSPQSERTGVFTIKQDKMTMFAFESDKKCDNHQETKVVGQETKVATRTNDAQKDYNICMKKCESSAVEIPESIPAFSTVAMTPERISIHHRKALLENIKKIDSLTSSPNFICDKKRVICETPPKLETMSMSTLKQRNINSINERSAKVYTPRPVSLYSKSELLDSASPEFFVKGKSFLTELAPIYTPLVLKSMAKNNTFSPEAELSPVRLKLEFTEIEKDTPRKETSKNQTATLQHIPTIQKKLDDLADRECFLLLNESMPIICGRYLTNPVASTLKEGDDMHFIPIQL